MRLHVLVAPLALAALASGATGLDLPASLTGQGGGPTLGLDVPDEADPAAEQRLRDLREASRYPHHAASARTARCLAEAGFPGYPVDPLRPGPVWDSTPYAPSPEQARIDGYDSVLIPLDTYGGDDARHLQGFSPQRLRAYHLAASGPDDAPEVTYSHPLVGTGGTLSGGCHSQGKIEVFGSLQEELHASSAVANFERAARYDAHRDPAVRELTTRWSRCMTTAGHRGLDDPFEALSEALGWAGGQDAGLRSGRAREIAVADADCQAELDYPEARRDVEARYVTALVNAGGFKWSSQQAVSGGLCDGKNAWLGSGGHRAAGVAIAGGAECAP